MTSQAQVTDVKTGLTPTPARSAAAIETIRRAGLTGEMALQSLFGHPGTQSMQQGLVRLVGHRGPSRPTAAVR
ncbi:hypothetical protein [Rhodopseudomonas sp.]|uniref:hypothetical protein n=1 Tax=Rhodopseudomonas sp. TaxID=1078 RepID=UPI003B3B20BF